MNTCYDKFKNLVRHKYLINQLTSKQQQLKQKAALHDAHIILRYDQKLRHITRQFSRRCARSRIASRERTELFRYVFIVA